MLSSVDSSVIAQLSNPDMRRSRYNTPLTYPARMRSSVKGLDLAKIGSLDFFNPELGRFPCLGLALAAAKKAARMPPWIERGQ